jgi:hypothetical protein
MIHSIMHAPVWGHHWPRERIAVRDGKAVSAATRLKSVSFRVCTSSYSHGVVPKSLCLIFCQRHPSATIIEQEAGAAGQLADIALSSVIQRSK